MPTDPNIDVKVLVQIVAPAFDDDPPCPYTDDATEADVSRRVGWFVHMHGLERTHCFNPDQRAGWDARHREVYRRAQGWPAGGREPK